MNPHGFISNDSWKALELLVGKSGLYEGRQFTPLHLGKNTVPPTLLQHRPESLIRNGSTTLKTFCTAARMENR
jgi:hypothetical protein